MAMLVGFESARIGIFNSETDEHIDPSKIFTVDAQQGGALGANITNLNYTPTPVYASNSIYRVSGKGTGAVSCAFTAEDIPMDIIYQITGADKNENGIVTIGRDTVAPYCALELISSDRDKNKVYLSLLKGVFGFPNYNLQTNAAQEVDVTDALTFTCVNRKSDNLVFAQAFASEAGFTETAWDSFIFPSYDAVTELTVTPTTLSLAVGGSSQIIPDIAPATANQAVTYSSSATSVATVSNIGFVTGVSAGTATITVKSVEDASKTASVSVTVA